MKKERNTQNRLGKELQTLLAPYPDPMSRTDFRKACQIGTRTSLYLLKSGLVPCTHTGKKTRCYKIAKVDVAEYLRRREAELDEYEHLLFSEDFGQHVPSEEDFEEEEE